MGLGLGFRKERAFRILLALAQSFRFLPPYFRYGPFPAWGVMMSLAPTCIQFEVPFQPVLFFAPRKPLLLLKGVPSGTECESKPPQSSPKTDFQGSILGIGACP